MAARDQVMSTERAPEPTMEEILASIRRIISDDEQSSAGHQTAPQGQSDDEGLESGEGEADDEIINDIARVLSGSGSSAEAEQGEDEILDLTGELGGLELVDEVEDIEEIELVEVAEETPEVFNPAPARQGPLSVVASLEPEDEPEAELELLEEVAEEEVGEEEGVEEPEAEAIEPEPDLMQTAPEMQPAAAAPRQMSASEEAASALERAIAALRAGQVPTSSSPFSFQPQPEPVFTPAPPPVFEPQPEPASAQAAPSFGLAPSFEPVPVPEPMSAQEPAPQPEAEPEFILTELEVETSEGEPVLVVETVTGEPKADRPWAMSSAPDWSTQREGELESAAVPHANGGGYPSQKSLEDSVKDMLRPMLQKWLDENMTRVLTAALKDELKDNPSRLQGQ
jgi:uncharacterized protein